LNHPRLVVICGFLTATPVADVLGFFFLFGFGPELEIYVFTKVFFLAGYRWPSNARA